MLKGYSHSFHGFYEIFVLDEYFLYEGKFSLLSWLKIHTYNLNFAESFNLFSLLVGYNQTSRARIMLDRASPYTSVAVRAL